MQIMHFILDKLLKLLTYYTPFYHQSLQSYLISKTVQFFWPTVYVLSNSAMFDASRSKPGDKMFPISSPAKDFLTKILPYEILALAEVLLSKCSPVCI